MKKFVLPLCLILPLLLPGSSPAEVPGVTGVVQGSTQYIDTNRHAALKMVASGRDRKKVIKQTRSSVGWIRSQSISLGGQIRSGSVSYLGDLYTEALEKRDLAMNKALAKYEKRINALFDRTADKEARVMRKLRKKYSGRDLRRSTRIFERQCYKKLRKKQRKEIKDFVRSVRKNNDRYDNQVAKAHALVSQAQTAELRALSLQTKSAMQRVAQLGKKFARGKKGGAPKINSTPEEEAAPLEKAPSPKNPKTPKPKNVLRGKVSYFGGGSDFQPVASGGNSDRPGVALNLRPGSESGWDNKKIDKWIRWAQEGRPMLVRVRTQGKTAVLPIIDKGPAGWTGRAIDITQAGLRKLGISPSKFKTDAWGTAEFLGRAKKKR